MSRKEKPGHSEESNHAKSLGLPIEMLIGIAETTYPINLIK